MAVRRDRLGGSRIRLGRYRFLAPVAVAAAIALGAWAPTVAASSSTPSVPGRSVDQVVASALSTHVRGFSGTVRWNANLGIPDLGSLAGSGSSTPGLSPTDLLSGTHTVHVWVAGADRQRLAIPGSLSEIDLVHNGDRAWVYDSTTDTVTDYVTAGGVGPMSPQTHGPDRPALSPGPLAPDALAARLLGHLSPTTRVTLGRPMTVAHRASYVLDLAPAPGSAGAAASTVRQISIAVDATTGLVLQVQIDARGQGSPALQVGFTSISYAVPGAGEFRPLTGDTVKTKILRAGHGGGSSADASDPFAGLIGASGWGGVARLHPGDLGSATSQLWEATTVVNGSFGTGRLLQTSLLNVLFLPNGDAVAGFVTPQALEAAAGRTG